MEAFVEQWWVVIVAVMMAALALRVTFLRGCAKGEAEAENVDDTVMIPVKMLHYISSFLCESPKTCATGCDTCNSCWMREWARGVMAEYYGTTEVGGTPAFKTPVEAVQISVTTVTDPDTGNEVDVTIYKEEGGAMVGVDSSYVEQDIGPVISSVGNGPLLIEGDV